MAAGFGLSLFPVVPTSNLPSSFLPCDAEPGSPSMAVSRLVVAEVEAVGSRKEGVFGAVVELTSLDVFRRCFPLFLGMARDESSHGELSSSSESKGGCVLFREWDVDCGAIDEGNGTGRGRKSK